MRYAGTLGTLLVLLIAAPHAEDREASERYSATLALERNLRTPNEQSPTLNDLRAAISSYETIQRQFPTSAYGDNALWQAAGLALEAFDRYHQQLDFNTGKRLLNRLLVDYPKSSLVLRGAERRKRFDSLKRITWLTDIEREVRENIVRVTVKFDGEVEFNSEQLERPAELFFDLHATDAAPPFRNTTLTFNGEAIRNIRLGRRPNQVTRIVLDTEGIDRCNTFTLYEPFRLVIDCKPSSHHVEALGTATVTPPPTSSSPLPIRIAKKGTVANDSVKTPTAVDLKNTRRLSLTRQLGLGISRVVIDAGHGGYDPGARARGLEEADIVLDIAKRLEQRLSTYPIEVVLTRRRDDYIPLEARTRLANRVDADLFLSIHANASPHTSTRGVETYFLNLTNDVTSETLAASENAATVETIGHLPDLLQAIATNDKLEESKHFAELVQQAIVDTLRKVDPEIPDLGVKQAPFIVLIGARMPSVLAEISFVTNEHDAIFLSTDVYRDLIADALFKAILRYERTLKKHTGLETVLQAGSG